MSDTVGQIALELNLDSDKFRKSLKNLNNTANNTAKSLTQSFSGSFKKIAAGLAAAFSVKAVVNFGKQAIESAASVQAANSQLEQTFGSLQNSAEAAMKRVADSSGILQTRLQGVGTSIYAFAKTTGMDSANALSMMEEALQVTADSAAYYDRSLEDTAESLKSFLKGNYENDAALGLSCTETTRNAAANKLYGKSFQELSEAQKQLTLLQMVKDANALSGAMGQAARESDNWENVTGNLQEAWKQFLAVIGQPVLNVAITVIKQITEAIQTLTSYAQMASEALAGLFGWADTSSISSSVSSAADSASILSSNTADSTDNIKATGEEAKKLKKTLAGFDQLNILSSDDTSSDSSTSNSETTSAITPVVDTSSTESGLEKSLNNVQKILEDFFKNCGINDFVSEIQKGIAKIDFSAIKDNFQSIMKNLKPIAKSTAKGLQKILKSSLKVVGSLIGNGVALYGKYIQTLSGGIAQWLDRDKDKISGYIDTISNDVSGGLEELSSFIDNMSNIVGGSLDRMRPQMENSIADFLSGTTTLLGSLSTIVTGAFSGASSVINQWSIDNAGTIGSFCDNIFQIIDDTLSLIGDIFLDTGNIMSDWWNTGGGKEMWDSIVQTVMDLGTIFMEVFNEWIMPAWDAVVSALQSAWNDCLAPVFEKIMNVLTKLWNEIIYPLWANLLKPLVDWIVGTLGPSFKTTFGIIGSICQTVFAAIGGYIGGVLDSLGGLIDFISGVFTGDWKKAWQGLCDYFKGIWNSIWSVLKGILNLIIDGINLVWSNIYAFAKGIVDTIGGISGAIGNIFGQDWSFSMPECPTIPKLARGGLVTAPTLALVGDNKNAQSDPEVVAPLSKLQNMLQKTENVAGVEQAIRLLQRIYELLNSEETQYINNIYLDGDVIEHKLVKVRKRKSRRYGGITT